MCLYPKLIRNKKYISNKKNKGLAPKCTDERTRWVAVGCGKCIECMKQKKRMWQVRLHEEIKTNQTGQFVTLTFSNKSLLELTEEVTLSSKEKILENEIATLAVRRFLENWRKETGKSIKHWLVTELGHHGTERIHLHGIIFTENKKMIIDKWKYGWVFIGDYIAANTINYIVKYINKLDIDHKGYISKILTSPGIGSNYIKNKASKYNTYNGKETNELYRLNNGQKLNLPVYYRNKIYSEDEREKLWINKLDKQERWIMGEKIDISKNTDQYEKLLKYYQGINKALGYGNDEKEWNKKSYIEQCHLLNFIKKHKEKEKNNIIVNQNKKRKEVFSIENVCNELNINIKNVMLWNGEHTF